MMISGNHDSAPRVNCFRSVLDRQKIYMIGIPPQTEEDHIEKVVLQDEYGPVNFYLLPFVKPSMVKLITGTDENGNNLSYNDTIHRLIEREQVNIETFWSAINSICPWGRMQKKLNEWTLRSGQ